MVRDRREQLLDTAVRLFYREGCHTVGIDRLLAEAGVAKMTLYKHFKSKDGLVLAAAERMRDQHLAAMRDYVDRHGGSAREKLLALFDFVAEWAAGEGFRGCPFQRLAVEYPEPAHPAHQAAARYKADQFRFILRLVCEAGVPEPERFTRRFLMLVDGAVALAQITGDLSPLQTARESAEALLADSLAAAAPVLAGAVAH